ncbi:MAG: hypothetical protein ACT4OI_06930 [Methanobacteriota archaeon]
MDFVRTGVAMGAAGSETTGDATNNHVFTNDGRTILHVRNSAGTATRNITLVLGVNQIDGQTAPNPAVAIAVNSSKTVGPFPQAIYNQSADAGKCYVNVDHADLRIQALRLP